MPLNVEFATKCSLYLVTGCPVQPQRTLVRTQDTQRDTESVSPKRLRPHSIQHQPPDPATLAVRSHSKSMDFLNMIGSRRQLWLGDGQRNEPRVAKNEVTLIRNNHILGPDCVAQERHTIGTRWARRHLP